MAECTVCSGVGTVRVNDMVVKVCPYCRGVPDRELEDFTPACEDFTSIAKGLKSIEIEKEKAKNKQCFTCNDTGWVWILYNHTTCHDCNNPKGLSSPGI